MASPFETGPWQSNIGPDGRELPGWLDKYGLRAVGHIPDQLYMEWFEEFPEQALAATKTGLGVIDLCAQDDDFAAISEDVYGIATVADESKKLAFIFSDRANDNDGAALSAEQIYKYLAAQKTLGDHDIYDTVGGFREFVHAVTVHSKEARAAAGSSWKELTPVRKVEYTSGWFAGMVALRGEQEGDGKE